MKLLFLDDERWRHDLTDRRHPDDVVQHAYTIRQFKNALNKERFDVVSLDHDLTVDESETGMDAVRHLVAMPRELVPVRIVVHSWNQDAARRMMRELRDAGFAPERIQFASESAARAAEAERRFQERNR
jgi:DNA-binding NtrC family response regulator